MKRRRQGQLADLPGGRPGRSGVDRVLRRVGGDRHENGQSEGSADLLGRVEYGRCDAQLGSLDP